MFLFFFILRASYIVHCIFFIRDPVSDDFRLKEELSSLLSNSGMLDGTSPGKQK